MFKQVANQAGCGGFAGGSGNGDELGFVRDEVLQEFSAVEDGDIVLFCGKQVGVVGFDSGTEDNDIGLRSNGGAVLRKKRNAEFRQLKIRWLSSFIPTIRSGD